jgi:hypothetical protein
MKIIEIFPVVRWIEIEADPSTERIEPHEQWAIDTIRKERNRLLAESDWRVLPDSPIENKEAWYAYRQSLRDFPEVVLANNFNNIPWAIPPS